jgi:Ca2+-dependent lipid-binding protein
MNFPFNINILLVITDAGVMYICIHGASGVKAADKTGASDPYCILFCNRRRVNCSLDYSWLRNKIEKLNKKIL